MPANRSRTERWRESLEQIAARNGGLEFSVARLGTPADATEPPADLMWRVRVFALSETELLVELPCAMGRQIHLKSGTEIVVVMTVGQNRWMFRSRVLGSAPLFPGSRATGLRLAAPEKVERCYRRDFLRVSTAELRLPSVECWPLLEPSSVVAAEAANRDRVLELIRTGSTQTPCSSDDLLPEVGPRFGLSLMNLGGGGVGLLANKDESTAAGCTKLVWMRVNLMPHIPAPIAMTAKIVHTHIDSAQNLYLGAAFEFAFNPPHREFVVAQIERYVGLLTQFKAAA